MEQTLKNFPKTAAALKELHQNIALLEETAVNSANEKAKLAEKLVMFQRQLAEKAASIDNIIKNLNGIIK